MTAVRKMSEANLRYAGGVNLRWIFGVIILCARGDMITAAGSRRYMAYTTKTIFFASIKKRYAGEQGSVLVNASVESRPKTRTPKTYGIMAAEIR